MSRVTVLNFSHPITPEQEEQIRRLVGDIEVVTVPFHLDVYRSIPDQVREIVDGIGWDRTEWESRAFIVNAPGMSIGALALIAEIAGRCGYLPAVLFLRRVDGVPPRFEVAAIIDLEESRLSASR